MPKKNTPAKSACAPRLWAKYSTAERRIWRGMYRMFLREFTMVPGPKVDAAQRKVIAHNCACYATWEARSHRQATIKTLGSFLQKFGAGLKAKR